MGIGALGFGDNGAGRPHFGQHIIAGKGNHKDIALVESLFHLLLGMAHAQIAPGRFLGDADTLYLHVADQLYLHQVGGAAHSQGNACRDNHQVPVIHQAAVPGPLDHMGEQLVGRGHFIHHQRGDAPAQIGLTVHGGVGCTADNGTLRAVFGDHAGGVAGFGYGDDRPGPQVMGRCNRCVGDGGGHIGVGVGGAVVKQLLIIDICLGTLGNTGHGANRLHRIITGGRFSGEHDGARSVINCIGDVRGFRTGGTGIVDHGIEHLGSGDDLFAGTAGFVDQFFLDNRDFLQWDFHAQIAAGHHDAVGGLQNGVDVLHTLSVLNLSDDPDVLAAQFFQKSAHFLNIIGRTGKGSGHIIKALLHAESQVLTVPLTDKGKGEGDPRNIDSLVGGNRTAVYHRTGDIRFCAEFHTQFDQAVVNQNPCSGGNIRRKSGKGDAGGGFIADHIPGGQNKLISSLQMDLFLFKFCQPDFRALGIQKKSNGQVQLLSNGFYRINPSLLLFVGAVGKVQPCHVHPCFCQKAQDTVLIGCRTQCTDNFCFSHKKHSFLFFIE